LKVLWTANAPMITSIIVYRINIAFFFVPPQLHPSPENQ
jgi:hypothetical protein